MSSGREIITFGDYNNGFQLGINNGTLNTGEAYHITERSEVYNTEGGAVFSGSISASRDVNITHINTIRPIAQSLYSSLFTSSEIFSQVRNEIGLLVSVLGATEEHAKKAHTESFCSSELKEALDNCKDALGDLSKLKEHFDSVGAQTQVTWERMGWSKTELANIKSNLSLYIQVLNSLIARMMLSSQSNVERMLRTLVGERRNGKNNSPALSIISNGSLAPNEKEQWRQLRKELQGVGITPEIFSLNREYILEYLGSFSQSESNTPVSVDHLETIEEDGTVPDELLEHDQGTGRDPYFRDYFISRGDSPLTTADYFPMNTEDTSLPESPSQAAEGISEFPQHEQQSSRRGWRETVVSPFPPPMRFSAPELTEEEMLDPGDRPSPIGDFRLYCNTNAPPPPPIPGPGLIVEEMLDSGDVLSPGGDFQLYDNTNIIPHTSSQDIYQPTSGDTYHYRAPHPESRLWPFSTTQHPQIKSTDTSKNLYPKRDAALLFGDFDTGEINSNDLLGLQNQPDFTNEISQNFPLESTNNTTSASGPVEDNPAISSSYNSNLRRAGGFLSSNPFDHDLREGYPPNYPPYIVPPSHSQNWAQPRMIYDAANRRQRNSTRTRTTAHSRPLGTARTRGISDSQRRRYTSASSTVPNFDEPPFGPYATEQDRIDYFIARRRNDTTLPLGGLDGFYRGPI